MQSFERMKINVDEESKTITKQIFINIKIFKSIMNIDWIHCFKNSKDQNIFN
jgi:hypothetical protein